MASVCAYAYFQVAYGDRPYSLVWAVTLQTLGFKCQFIAVIRPNSDPLRTVETTTQTGSLACLRFHSLASGPPTSGFVNLPDFMADFAACVRKQYFDCSTLFKIIQRVLQY
jgi:hypothetical protein